MAAWKSTCSISNHFSNLVFLKLGLRSTYVENVCFSRYSKDSSNIFLSGLSHISRQIFWIQKCYGCEHSHLSTQVFSTALPLDTEVKCAWQVPSTLWNLTELNNFYPFGMALSEESHTSVWKELPLESNT